jgi:hypothetical protein
MACIGLFFDLSKLFYQYIKNFESIDGYPSGSFGSGNAGNMLKVGVDIARLGNRQRHPPAPGSGNGITYIGADTGNPHTLLLSIISAFAIILIRACIFPA